MLSLAWFGLFVKSIQKCLWVTEAEEGLGSDAMSSSEDEKEEKENEEEAAPAQPPTQAKQEVAEKKKKKIKKIKEKKEEGGEEVAAKKPAARQQRKTRVYGKRHSSALKQTNPRVSQSAVRRLARRAGVLRVAKCVYELSAQCYFLRKPQPALYGRRATRDGCLAAGGGGGGIHLFAAASRTTRAVGKAVSTKRVVVLITNAIA
jgi:hypothetical protein